MSDSNNGFIFFRAAKKFNRVLITNPCILTERYQSGQNKGKVKSKRQIQFAYGFDTLDPAEQRKIDPNVKPASLRLDFKRKEIIKFPEEDIWLIQFLRQCQDNTDNGGKIFREVDVEKEKEYQLEAFKKYDEAIAIVMKADNNTSRAMAMWLLSPAKMKLPVSDIKIELRTRCQTEDFQDKVIAFNNEKSNNEKLLIAVALEKEVIQLIEGRKFAWSDGEMIYVASQAKDAIREFSLWLNNDEEGREYAKVIASKTKKN